MAWIATIAMVALLAAVVLHPASAPAISAPSRASAPHWQTVASASGDATGATAPFVTTKQWRVVWSANAAGKSPNFGILVEQPGSQDPYDTIANVIGSGHGTAVERGKGTFYLDVQGAEPYHLRVQTYAAKVPAQPHYAWTTVATTSGRGASKSALPQLHAPWRISWSTQGAVAGTFAISVMQRGAQLPVDYVANISGKASGVAYEYESGRFHLDIAATEPFQITVQQGAKN